MIRGAVQEVRKAAFRAYPKLGSKCDTGRQLYHKDRMFPLCCIRVRLCLRGRLLLIFAESIIFLLK